MTFHSAAWHFELTCFKFGFSSHRPVLAVAACLSGGDSSRKNFNSGLPTKVGQNDLEDPLRSQIKKNGVRITSLALLDEIVLSKILKEKIFAGSEEERKRGGVAAVLR